MKKLRNSAGMEVTLSERGARVTSIMVPDRQGNVADVALGFRTAAEYAAATPYLGCTVGRYGNRIAGGRFELEGKVYNLARNNGPNHLHGGIVGFDKVLWSVTHPSVNSVAFSYLSRDGEEGYPGNLEATVTYELTEANELCISYRATTDKATPVNLTNHTYFNLAGEGYGDILRHQVTIHAERYTPVDETAIPTGELASVAGTPFDFRTPKTLGRDIDQDHEQLRVGGGYDHNFALADGPQPLTLAATVYEPESGRLLEVLTEEPGVQLYTGNFLDGSLHGKSGKPYGRRSGFCLETQHFPDSPNQPAFPSTILRPGEIYETQTIYRFSARRPDSPPI